MDQVNTQRGKAQPLFFYWLLVLWAVPVFAQSEVKNIYEAISRAFPSASPLIIIILGTTSIILLGLVVLWEIFKSDRLRQERAELSWKNFGEYVTEKELSPGQEAILKEIVLVGQINDADTVFTAPAVFERCLEEYIRSLKKKHRDSEETYGLLHSLRRQMGYSRLPEEVHLTSSRQLTPGMHLNITDENNEVAAQGILHDGNEQFWTVELAGNSVNFHKGQDLYVSFIRHGDAEYRIKCRCLGNSSDKLQLEHSLSLERKQLRNWVRVEVNLPCQARLMRPLKEEKAGTVYQGRIMDISGGGMCLRLENHIPPGTLLSLNFDLPENSIRSMHSEVISSNSGQGAGKRVYIHRLKFNNIETAVQEKIVRFVFEKNRVDSQFR